MTEKGNRYRLTLEDGKWTSAWIPVLEEIENTGAFVRTREDAPDYDLFGAAGSLDGSGSGVMSVGEFDYRVTRDAKGNFTADVIDSIATVIDDDSDVRLVEEQTKLQITVFEDLVVEFPLSELYTTGISMYRGLAVVEGVKRDIEAHMRDFLAWIELSSESEYYWQQKRELWKVVNATLARLGLETSDGGILGELELPVSQQERAEEEGRAIDLMKAAVAALASPEAFQAALSNGIFSDNESYGSGDRAAEIFAAPEIEISMSLSLDNALRFGVWVARTRENAHDEIDPDSVTVGQVAYTSSLAGRPWPTIPLLGHATFAGETVAIDSDDNSVSAKVTLEASFAEGSVMAVISDLTVDETGATWNDGVGEVREIQLPTALITRPAGDASQEDSVTWVPGSFRGEVLASQTEDGISHFRNNPARVTYLTVLQSPTESHLSRAGFVEGRFFDGDSSASPSSAPPGGDRAMANQARRRRPDTGP